MSLRHLLFIKIQKNNNNRNRALVSMLSPSLLWGSPWFYALGTMLVSCGGGRTLVEPNYALVTCSGYGKFFRIMALLGIILDLECIKLHALINTPHHLNACTF